jgi:hypothetical protein
MCEVSDVADDTSDVALVTATYNLMDHDCFIKRTASLRPWDDTPVRLPFGAPSSI